MWDYALFQVLYLLCLKIEMSDNGSCWSHACSAQESSLQRCKCFGWNGQAVWIYETILDVAVKLPSSYHEVIILCKLNCGYHNKTHFQYYHLPNGTLFTAVKFTMGYEKNRVFLMVPKSPKIALGLFNIIYITSNFFHMHQKKTLYCK